MVTGHRTQVICQIFGHGGAISPNVLYTGQGPGGQLPLFIWGIITNYIPYILPRILLKITKKDQSEEASWKLIYGFIFFVFYYAASITLFWKLTQNLFLTFLFISSLIPSGDFALYYSKNIKKYKQHVKFLSIFYEKRTLIFEIIQRRIELLQFIEESKNRYLQTIK